MGLFVALAYPGLSGVLGTTGMMGILSAFGVIGMAVVLYFALLVVFRALPYEDIMMLPKGAHIAKWLKMEKEAE